MLCCGSPTVKFCGGAAARLNGARDLASPTRFELATTSVKGW